MTLIPWSRVLLEKLIVTELVKKFPAFNGIRRFITVLTTARQWSLSWARSIQSTFSQPFSLRSILILSSHLRMSLSSGFFPSGFQIKILYSFLISHACYIPLPSRPPSLDHPNNIWWSVQVVKLLIMQPSRASRPFLPLRFKYSPQYPVLYTLNLCSSLSVRDQVSHPYKTTGKILILLY